MRLWPLKSCNTGRKISAEEEGLVLNWTPVQFKWGEGAEGPMPGWTDNSVNTWLPAPGYDLLNDFMIPQGISHNDKKYIYVHVHGWLNNMRLFFWGA
jgi:hypothetical protein